MSESPFSPFLFFSLREGEEGEKGRAKQMDPVLQWIALKKYTHISLNFRLAAEILGGTSATEL